MSIPFDPHMSTSHQWYFRSAIDDEGYYLIFLNFSEEILETIYSTL